MVRCVPTYFCPLARASVARSATDSSRVQRTQLNLSTTELESYQRHLPFVKIAFPLPGELFVTAKAQLNLVKSDTRTTVPLQNIDEDNRSLALLTSSARCPRLCGERPLQWLFSLPSDGTAPISVTPDCST